MKKRKIKYKYEVSYYDPNDPSGERWKTWRYTTLKKARIKRNELLECWEATKSEIPINKIKR